MTAEAWPAPSPHPCACVRCDDVCFAEDWAAGARDCVECAQRADFTECHEGDDR